MRSHWPHKNPDYAQIAASSHQARPKWAAAAAAAAAWRRAGFWRHSLAATLSSPAATPWSLPAAAPWSLLPHPCPVRTRQCPRSMHPCCHWCRHRLRAVCRAGGTHGSRARCTGCCWSRQQRARGWPVRQMHCWPRRCWAHCRRVCVHTECPYLCVCPYLVSIPVCTVYVIFYSTEGLHLFYDGVATSSRRIISWKAGTNVCMCSILPCVAAFLQMIS